jgi:hypothetical protein
VDTTPKKNYFLTMNKFKNLLIAILTGLLGLSLFTFPAQGAGKSKEAKTVEYQFCLNLYKDNSPVSDKLQYLNNWITACAKYRP